jgi:protein-disulfide isomerase
MFARSRVARVLGGTALAVAISAGLSVAAPREAAADPTVAVQDLMAPQALPDIWLGKADAPVTVIEYASMTCPHCAAFHKETFPTLKSKYIDSGKVRFVLREFPLDPLATAGFMLARCIGPDKRNAMVDLLFDEQQNWAFTDKPLDGLLEVVKQTGMTKDAVDACLDKKDLYDQVTAERDAAGQKFNVQATPTFFINGNKVEGEMSPSDLDKAIAPFLKS